MNNFSEIQLIRETKWWLAVNKPAGIITEVSAYEHPTMEDLVCTYLTEKDPRCFLGIIHRLDRVTSGVWLVAKKKAALKHLNQQFASRTVAKTYWAIVEQAPPKQKGVLTHWLEKDNIHKKAQIHLEAHPKAQQVQLKYEVLASLPGKKLLEIQPYTGKFHQIRAQLSAVGCPIIGDHKYGPNPEIHTKNIALHARNLVFDDPQSGERITIEAPLPTTSFWKDFL